MDAHKRSVSAVFLPTHSSCGVKDIFNGIYNTSLPLVPPPSWQERAAYFQHWRVPVCRPGTLPSRSMTVLKEVPRVPLQNYHRRHRVQEMRCSPFFSTSGKEVEEEKEEEEEEEEECLVHRASSF